MNEFIVVWDVAKNADATVIQTYRKAVEIIGDREHQRSFCYLNLVHQVKMEQVPYTEQVRRVVALMGQDLLKNNADLLIDGTGVGQAVSDIAREKGLSPIEIIFSGGVKVNVHYDGGQDARFKGGLSTICAKRGYSVPKVDMIDAAKVMLEQNRLRIEEDERHPMPYKAEFKQQLLHFQGRINDKGHTEYGNDEIAKHDDFVAAFIMACWWVRYNERETMQLEHRLGSGDTSYTWNPYNPIF